MIIRATTALLTPLVCLLLSASASAAEIAHPIYWKTAVRTKPNGPTDGLIRAAARSGGPSGYLVIDKREVAGRQWIALRIAKRPNDRVGWIPADRVELEEARGKIFVSVVNRTMTLLLDDKPVWKTKVVVGKPSTPTPRGLFAIHDFYRVDDDLRPWVIETTAHSEVLDSFLGGPARVALHGRHGALRVPWGIAASNGCVRTPDWALRSIRKLLRPGSPIEIR